MGTSSCCSIPPVVYTTATAVGYKSESAAQTPYWYTHWVLTRDCRLGRNLRLTRCKAAAYTTTITPYSCTRHDRDQSKYELRHENQDAFDC